MRDLPRQLSAEELAELFEGRTRFVELLAEREDPLDAARGRDRRADRGREAGGARTRIRRSARATSRARSAAEQGADADPVVLTELAVPQPGLRGEVRLPLRRLRRTAGRRREILDGPPRAARAHARGGARDRARRSWSRSRAIAGDSRLMDSVRDRLAAVPRSAGSTSSPAIVWIGTSFYFIALDNHLRPAGGRDGRGSRRRRRGLGDPRRRLLPVQKYRRRARRGCPSRSLVQVGGLHDLALGLRAAGVLYYFNADTYLIDPSVADLSTAEAIAISIGGLVARVAGLRRALPALGTQRARRSRSSLLALVDARRVGQRASSSAAARRVHAGRRDARDDHGRRTSSS